MKTFSRLFALSAVCALVFATVFPAVAQQSTPTAERPDSADVAPAAPAASAAPVPPVEPPSQVAPAAPAPAAETTTAEPPLRRIDQPAAAAPASDDARSASTSAAVEKAEDGKKGAAEEKPATGPTRRKRGSGTRHGNQGDFPMGDHRVAKGTTSTDAVSILGSTVVDGQVNGDAVSILGNTSVGPEGSVTGAAVAVLGKLNVQGKVANEAVSVLGGVNIDGEVKGQAVSVLGNMRLGPNAVVNGDIVIVMGKLSKAPGAVVHGNEINAPGFGGIGDIEWLTTWFTRCLLLGRPLAFGAHLGWAWLIAFSFLAFYAILALLFPRAVEHCAETLETRPGYSIVSSMLTVLLTPVVIILLLFTIVGALLVPFLLVGLVFASLFGKAVMLAWLGRRVGQIFRTGGTVHAAVAVLIGGVIVLGLYVVPFLGFLMFKLLGWLGLGVVVYTLALKMKRERPPAPPMPVVPPAPVAPPASPAAPGAPGFAAPAPMAAVPMSSEPAPGFSGNPAPAGAAGFAAAAIPTAIGAPPVTPTAFPAAAAIALPRASLMIRLGALLLDIILVAVVTGFLSSGLPHALRFGGPPGLLPLMALYGAIMWKMKGTTIGGIVCGLKVVRLDGRELDWGTAIVRALGCFLSLIVVGLGFIWIAIDEERQSWHDKIAGTIVVRVPKSMPLV